MAMFARLKSAGDPPRGGRGQGRPVEAERDVRVVEPRAPRDLEREPKDGADHPAGPAVVRLVILRP
jgi:hypothetical protein